MTYPLIKSSFDTFFDNILCSRQEFLKYEIGKFTIRYSKTKAKERRQKIEENLRTLERDLKNDKNIKTNIKKEELSMMYDEVCIDIKIRSGCNWYDLGENFNKFFLSIKKKNGCQNTLGNIEWRAH